MRRNPTYTTSSKGMKPVMDGMDNLPNPSGKNMDVQEEGNAMPEVDMTPNDGDQPTFATPPFASGKDTRITSDGPQSDPVPGKVGAL